MSKHSKRKEIKRGRIFWIKNEDFTLLGGCNLIYIKASLHVRRPKAYKHFMRIRLEEL